ncbi:hypothetical protein RHMOL_Rhmol01G0228500 [Rhododendron molle]|uniref:Uncharacterized protein n=1 Tax=Rhododendron molle TaxID=49168 RepID=A0ACC0Q7U1_RHOML|nr:hypothetical protein RHMOL_Rhmol01G0228500 [Rhododendron molle]
MADHGTGGGEGEVIDRSEDRGGPMEVKRVDQTTTEETGIQGAVATDGGDGEQGRPQQEVGGGDEHRATVEASPAGSIVEPVGSGTVAEGSLVVRGSSEDARGSGVVGDDTGQSRTAEGLGEGKGGCN